MRSDAAITALRDIAHHIDLAVRFTTGFDYEAFVADPHSRERSPDRASANHPPRSRAPTCFACFIRSRSGIGSLYRRPHPLTADGPGRPPRRIPRLVFLQSIYKRALLVDIAPAVLRRPLQIAT